MRGPVANVALMVRGTDLLPVLHFCDAWRLRLVQQPWACHVFGVAVVMSCVTTTSKKTTMARNIAAIAPQSTCLTLINVYGGEPESEDELAKALSESTETTIRHQPSFISAWLCFSNPVMGSFFGSSIVAWRHEQSQVPELQDHELAGL